ncbi:YihY/virulence factor BrkB family protein [Dyadobacter subterraneus]|uniref:YihY/virulence factor BrkB family protein n=1 Tax=Dyadobacter subterraneus TaxID=2773304 RepID=A0ABR9W8A9_9BACT|nr:YihY/virulence factor BrkB family protein [Dyadobacter subterraneus]MBE9461715.1 YihY/virulence factor BrkB family protein [Dyadobacter subterraneus]
MNKIKFTFSLIKDSFNEFMNDNGLKLAAALSYYTVFSLAPMLLVIISVVSFFYGREAFTGELFGQISGLVGKDAAAQLQEIIKNAEISNKSTVAATVGVVTLLIGATGVFAEIQDSINYIWSIKSKPKKSWLAYLKNRLLSFSVILTLGFLLIVSLGVNTAIDLLSSRLERYFSEVSVIIFSGLNIILVLIVLTALFTAIFKVLPDGHVRWKECMIGAAFTAVMFAIGKFGISLYLGQQDLGATYGASASIVILLTWVYYSSIILYFGAEFTKVYAKTDGEDISPNEHAVLISRKEVVEKQGSSMPEVAEPSTKSEPSLKLVASLPEEGKKLIHTVIKFIDDKFDILKQQILPVFESVAATVTFYVLVAISAFTILITCLVLLGNFLNKELDSYYLGYVILLGTFLILGAASIFLRKNVQEAVRKLLISMNKA